MPSKVAATSPLPTSDDEAPTAEPPRFHRKRSMPKDDAAPPPPSSTPPSIPSSSQPSSEKLKNGSSSSHARRNSTSTPATKGYDSSTASSSSPVRPSRPQSFHGTIPKHLPDWRIPEPRKPNILNAKSWTQLPCPKQQLATSSVASTSRITLDSASSWGSTTDSATDRPSSATSATSTGSFAETPQPREKAGFSALPRSQFAPTLATLPPGSRPA